MAPTFTAGVDVGFALGPNAELTLAARYDHIFEQRGDTKYYNIATGAQTGELVDVGGAALAQRRGHRGPQGLVLAPSATSGRSSGRWLGGRPRSS